MPNWCVGTLKVRGEKDNIRKFVKEGFELPPTFLQIMTARTQQQEAPESQVPEIEEDKYGVTIKGNDLYIRGTRRMFVSKGFEWDSERNVLVIDDVCAA